MESVVVRVHSNISINQRKSDGYFDATAMCKAGTAETGKRKDFHNYFNTTPTQEFLKELSSVTGLAVTDLVQVIQGGRPELQGTWIHPRVATHLAQWCSPKFAVVVSEWVLDILTNNRPVQPEIKLPDLTTAEGMAMLFGALAASAKIQVDLSNKVKALEASQNEMLELQRKASEVLNNIEPPSGPPREKSWRSRTEEVIVSNASQNGGGMLYSQNYNKFYREFELRYHFDPKARAKAEKFKSGLDVIEHLGLAEDGFKLAYSMFAPKPQLSVVPRQHRSE